MDVGEASAADGPTVPLRVHSLLLALAGRMDDSALTSAHELVARADVDEAAELTAGTLIAGRIPVSGAEHNELASILELSQCDPTLVDDLFVDELGSAQTHRFSGDVTEYGSPETGVGSAIERVTRVLPDVRAVHAVWRLTPAGAIPAALPTRVVLVEVGPEANPPAVAYRIDVALRRAEIDAVVEVTSSDLGRSRYHESALMSAREIHGDGFTSVPGSEAPDGGEAVAPAPSSHGPAAPRIARTRAQRRNNHAESSDSGEPTVADTYVAKPAHHAQGAPSETETHWSPEPAPNSARELSQEPMPVREQQEPESWATTSRLQPGGGSRFPEPAESPEAAESPLAAEFPQAAESPQAVEHLETAPPPETAPHPDAVEPRETVESLELSDNSEPWRSAFVEPVGGEGGAAAPQWEERNAGEWAPDPEERVASTTEMTPAEMAQLRQALAEDPEKGRQIAASVRPGEVVEIPELDLNDPQLSERDRELLRELHAELAARERADAGKHGVNGSQGS